MNASPRRGAAILASCLALWGLPASAQVPHDDIERLAAFRALPAGNDEHVPTAARPASPPQLIAVGALRVYRSVLSSQDAYRCQFHPSCSHFAEDAVRQAGTLRGVLMASDRVQRCNPFAPRYYPRRGDDSRLDDPVDDYVGASTHGANAETRDSTRRTGRAWLAGGLSAVVPGLGKVYAGRPLDGLASFIAVGVPATFSVTDFRRSGGGSFRGWFQGTLALGFYAGGIWGAAHASRSGADPRDGGQPRRPAGTVPDTAPEPSVAWSGRNGDPAEHAPRRSACYDSALAAYANGRFPIAAARFLDVAEASAGTELATRARFFQALSHAEQGQWGAARAALELVTRASPSGPDSQLLATATAALDSLQRAARLSPRRARVLSGLAPGAGAFYARDLKRGVTAMGVCILLGNYVRSTVRSRSYPELVISALPLFWRYYRGGIESAGHAAERYNARLDDGGGAKLRTMFGIGQPRARSEDAP